MEVNNRFFFFSNTSSRFQRVKLLSLEKREREAGSRAADRAVQVLTEGTEVMFQTSGET